LTLDEFDFDLPERLIAQRPARPRDSARLLHLPNDAPLEDKIVRDLPDLLRAGDVLIANDSAVIPAALAGVRQRKGALGEIVRVHVNLHQRAAPQSWRALVRPAKRLQIGDQLHFERGPTQLRAEVRNLPGEGEALLDFDRAGHGLDLAIAAIGDMPIPPYLRRPADDADRVDYQTLFAARDGSVAAPTAGLHFTPDLTRALEARGVTLSKVTLHVGAGTFLPVKTDDLTRHVMHAETCAIDADTAALLTAAKAQGRRLIAIGTTALRTLETFARPDGTIAAGEADTTLFVTPGYAFKAVDGLLTNFHLPKSTLFMLVAAFCGLERIRAAYAHAIAKNYRFFSYGDASLLWRASVLAP